jgi:hypothetical protein
MFSEYFVYNIPTTTLSAGTGVTFTDVPLNISNNDFLFKRTIHFATANTIYKKILDNNTGRYLFKGAQDLRSVSGTALSGITTYGFTPYNWPNPYKANRNAVINIALSDFANNGNNIIDMAYHGDSLSQTHPIDVVGKPVDYSEKRRTVPIIYALTTITPASTIGAQVQGVIITDVDADFVCTKITGVVTAASYISIYDSGRDSYWQNIKTHSANLIGNGQFPNVLTSPRFVKAQSTLIITFENNVNSANALQLYLHGYKRFAS